MEEDDRGHRGIDGAEDDMKKDGELDDEIRSHLRMAAEERMARGES